jgi:hypothetical protein
MVLTAGRGWQWSRAPPDSHNAGIQFATENAMNAHVFGHGAVPTHLS